MNSTMETRFISVTIDVPFETANDFLSRPENMALWAAGLGSGFKHTGGRWVVESAEGEVVVRFTQKNPFGIADHWVEVSPEHEVYIPVRVIHNGSGSEVTVTLFRQPEMDDAMYERDAGLVRHDLQMLKSVLEQQ